MTVLSILFEDPYAGSSANAPAAVPAFFADLNLDQIVDAVTAGRQEYNLKPLFCTPLNEPSAIAYRHATMRDLENDALYQSIQSFAQQMRAMRQSLAQSEKLHYRYQKEWWFLHAVDAYCAAVAQLLDDLSRLNLTSRAFLAMRDYLADYVHADRFVSLQAETRQRIADLSSVKYCLRIKENAITVRKYDGEIDYSRDVEATFEKFKQGAVKDYRVKFGTWAEMNHVEAQILDLVARLYPEVFSSLDEYCAVHRNYLDETIAVFDREVQFCVAYLDFIARLKRSGLQFCYPQIATQDKEVYDLEGFDLALANKLLNEGSTVVCNDFYLKGKERILIVTGPNQGGKTTFARAFGQLHYLARLGCPVPGREARLFLFDQLFTHFESEEHITNLRGKLQDDLVRMREILQQVTPNSIVIINEIFTSTTLSDAIFLSKKILETITEVDALCVCVTFIDELASLSEKTVSVVSTVVPDNPAVRTYKIVRKPADGLAYALSIAEKYRLTYECLKERIPS
jgi:DNA mismatch repair protein MutS